MGIKNGNVVQAKAGTVSRTDTSAKTVFTLPSGVMVTNIRAFGPNSDAATSATLTLKAQPTDGSAAAATFATINAKSTVNGATPATLAGIAYQRQSTPVVVTITYSESGTASTVGGDWTFVVEYL